MGLSEDFENVQCFLQKNINSDWVTLPALNVWPQNTQTAVSTLCVDTNFWHYYLMMLCCLPIMASWHSVSSLITRLVITNSVTIETNEDGVANTNFHKALSNSVCCIFSDDNDNCVQLKVQRNFVFLQITTFHNLL